jgi:hydroxypyruvate isomerase
MLNRRHFLSTAAAAASSSLTMAQSPAAAPWRITKGRIRQSVVHWNMKPLTIVELADAAAALGMASVELIGPEHWPLLKERGLTCAIAGSHGFAKGFAHVDEHDECIAKLRQSIDACAAHNVQSVITFSGFRRELDDATAHRNMIDGLKKILPYAEEKKVTLCLEMLNSIVAEEMKGHPDYWCDHIDKALKICQEINSPRMKILFDLYHVQIMDGDLIRNFQKCREHIGHIHTAGNPGRCELDDTQEINYPPIMRAIAESGYPGYVGQEFIPRSPDKVAALRDAVRLCDV